MHDIGKLAEAVRTLPTATAAAMLVGLQGATRVVCGTFVDAQQGVCPLLAAHRSGAPATPTGFYAAWDAFCGVTRRTRRAALLWEVHVLEALLERRVMPASERDVTPTAPATVQWRHRHRRLMSHRAAPTRPASPHRALALA